MTIVTNPPTGAFRITPDDGSIYAFALGRAPEFGNVQEHDLGQTVARSEGTKVYILGKSVEANVYRFKIRGLTSHEFHYLRLYVQDQLQGSKEKATFEWGRARNRILYSSTAAAQDSENFSGWQKLGASPPVVTDNQFMSPEGFAASSSRVVFSGSAGDSALRCPGVLADFSAGSGHVSVTFLAKVTDGGGGFDIQVDSSAPGFFQATIPDSGIAGGAAGGWHRISGDYQGWVGDHLDIQNFEAGSRTIGLTDVSVIWHPTRPVTQTFYDPVPLNTIEDARYVPDSIVGRQLQGDMWDVEFLVREEVA